LYDQVASRARLDFPAATKKQPKRVLRIQNVSENSGKHDILETRLSTGTFEANFVQILPELFKASPVESFATSSENL